MLFGLCPAAGHKGDEGEEVRPVRETVGAFLKEAERRQLKDMGAKYNFDFDAGKPLQRSGSKWEWHAAHE